MSIEQYFDNVRGIHEELAKIAIRTSNMAHTGSAHTENSDFVNLMNRHTALIRQFQELHASFIKENPQFFV